jgi:Pyruvate/2-oxoacid:ferredoxin oxidoreductase delta subunit
VKIRRKSIEIDAERCSGCGKCVAACVEGAIAIIDGKARLVSESYCDGLGACLGECPEGALRITSKESEEFDPEGVAGPIPDTASALAYWPIQIRLIPPAAPFLKDADLLVAADCTTLAYAHFHQDLLPGRVVMLGCPKFDDTESYVTKFAEIFQVANIRSITVVEMKVPCCRKLPLIVRAALARSKKDIPLEEVIISRKGKVKSEK